jgi:amino acid adenylation domain-containing protein
MAILLNDSRRFSLSPSPPDWFLSLTSSRASQIALECGEERLTYQTLDQRSTAVAGEIAARGVAPRQLVGVCMQRTPRLLVVLLGILKAGDAYLPLDPDYPDERLLYMLEHSGAALLVTDHATRAVPTAVPAVYAEDLEDELGARPTAFPPTPAAESDLAYVIYTSGSTGRPKGVEITHGALANLLRSMCRVPGIAATDRVLAHTTLTFDISALELWAPLVAGATVVLVDRRVAVDAHLLAAAITTRHITVLQATPTTWSLLLEAGWRAGAGITALSGGEPLPRQLADAIHSTGADLWNMYGPTETTVWSSAGRVGRDGPITIGRPIDQTTLHVLNPDNRPVRPGEAGELYIGGAGVARGYRNQPVLTAERFVPDPFSTNTMARLFRTGDRARLHADGQIECLGRLDDQLKIDGHRIEPGEIETVLRAVPGVANAAVVAHEHPLAGRRLAAYVVPAGDAPSPDALRRAAAARLPHYMIPSSFVMLSALPRTPGGKINRRALPKPEDVAREPLSGLAAPTTATEQALAALWEEVLGIPQVGIHDDFFAIGGRSRLGAHLFARIAEQFGKVLPLALLFEEPTVAGLAAAVDRSCSRTAWSALVPVGAPRTSAQAPFICVHPRGGQVLIYRDLGRHLGPDIPFYALQPVGLDGSAPPLETVEAMAERYLCDVRSLQPHGPYLLGGFSFGGLVAFEMARRLRIAGETVALLALLDTEFPPAAASRTVRWLGGSRSFQKRIYPLWLRVRGHRASLRRLGPAKYAALMTSKVRGLVGQHRASDVTNEPMSDWDEMPKGGADPFSRAVAEVMAANDRAMARYIPQRYDGAITFFRAADARFENDTRPLWSNVARQVDVHVVPGEHFTIRVEPHVAVLAGRLRQCLLNAAASPAREASSPVVR